MCRNRWCRERRSTDDTDAPDRSWIPGEELRAAAIAAAREQREAVSTIWRTRSSHRRCCDGSQTRKQRQGEAEETIR